MKTGFVTEMVENGPRFCPGLSSMVRLFAISGDPMPQQKSASGNKRNKGVQKSNGSSLMVIIEQPDFAVAIVKF